MKKIVIMLLGLVLASGTAFAAGSAGSGVSIDLSGNYASEPESGFDGTFGPELGCNIDLSRAFGTSKGLELQGRASLSYYSWDADFFGDNLEIRRIPLFVGGRILTSVSPQVKLYGQLGLELSFDKVEMETPFFGKVSDDETNLGITPGIGVIVPVSNQFYIGGNASWHIIDSDYFTIGVTVGVNL